MSPLTTSSKKMTTFLRSLVTGNGTVDPTATKPRPDGFLTAKGIDALFPRTDPTVDGEECLHDCASCTISLPRKWSIDTTDALYGEIKGWSRHLIVATGKSDWVRDVADEPHSVMAAVSQHHSSVTDGKLMLSASNLPVPDDPHASGPYGPDRPTTVLLLPAFVFVDRVTPTLVPQLISAAINPSPTNTTLLPSSANVYPSVIPTPLPAGLALRSCPHRAIILLCSQGTRDARCGQSAPLLKREFERHLRARGLQRDDGDERVGGVGVHFISHVGGHKYSANVLVYRRRGAEWDEEGRRWKDGGKEDGGKEAEAGQCIWLARIRPEDCENVVRYTVLQGKVVKPDSQLRGGFDRERGVVSW